MRRQQTGQKRISKRFIRIILGLFVVLIATGCWGVYHAVSPIVSAQTQAEKLATKYAGLKTKTGFYWTNLNQTYYTVAGTDSQKRAVYVIVPKKGGQLRVLPKKDGVSRNAILRQIWREKKPKKVLQAALGIFNDKPAWYINYLNQKNQLCYETVSFETGKTLQSIANI